MPPREDEDDVTETGDEPEAPATPAKSKANGSKRAHTATRGIGAPPDDAPKDAAELWDWIVAKLSAQGISPYAVRIGVYQVDPPAPGTGSEFMVGSVMGGNVMGSETMPPGQALFEYIIQNFHMTRPASRTAVRYSVRFQWASNTQQFKRGEITLPPAAEIAAVRAEQARSRAAEQGETPSPPQPNAASMGVGSPMTPQAAAQHFYPPYAYPPPYAPPPPQQPSGFGSPEQMFDLMREMFRAATEQRPPVIPPGFTPPPGVAAPQVNEEAIVRRVTESVVGALKTAGVFDRPAAVAPTVAAPPPTPAGRMEKFGERLFDAVMGQVEQSFRRSLAGVGKPPPTPEEALPFRVQPVPEAKWRDGRPINYAADDDGKISLQGTLASNPIILETAMDTVVGLAGEVKNLLGRVASSASGPLGAKPPSMPPAAPTPAIGAPAQEQKPAPPAAVPSWRE